MKLVKLSSLGTLKNGMNFSKESATKGCKIIGVADFGNRVFPDYSTLEEIDSSIVGKDCLLQNGDILFVRSNGNKNLVGRSMFIKDITEPVCYSGFCISFRPNTDLVVPEYLFYALRSPFCRKQYSYSLQTNITNLSQGVLGAVEVPLPSYEEQKKLSKLLLDLDKSIQLNQNMSDKLLKTVKTIYDYWFVQFEFPNAEGKPYKSSGGEMVWCEGLKKEIPKGWSCGGLENIANIIMGQSPDGNSYNDNGEGMIFYQGKTDFGMRFPSPRMYTTAPTRFAKKGDILLSVRAPVGALNVAMEDCCIGRGLAALNSKVGSNLHLYYTLLSLHPVFQIYNGNGTTFGSITKENLYKMVVVIPPKDIVAVFEDYVCAVDKRIVVCEEQNRSLEAQRNWLLPLLMNGQATIKQETTK